VIRYQDIAWVLRKPRSVCEDKIATPVRWQTGPPEETIKVPSVGRSGTRDLVAGVAEVVEPRYEELFTLLIQAELARSGFRRHDSGGNGLTGGLEDGRRGPELAGKFSQCRSAGVCRRNSGVTDVVRNPFSHQVGLLH